MASLLGLLTTASFFIGYSLAAPTTTAATATSTAAGVIVPSGAPILDLGYAKYLGTSNTTTGVTTYNGIYFAQPPTGQFRWQPPRDIELNNTYSPDKVINATAYGPTCVQGTDASLAPGGNISAIVVPPPGSEDCLLLNIQVPIKPKSKALPIIVYIHGGGYDLGSSQQSGDPLIRASGGALIFVSVQYRLGPYGFLANNEVKNKGVGNAGLLDQRAAIQWVQRNAASFGGDLNAITIMGGSAGGGSVMSQLIMYGGVANPPFRAVISEFPWWQPFKSGEVLEAQYRYLLETASCNSLECLRGLSEHDLAVATQNLYFRAYRQPGGYGYGDFYFGPAVDGFVIKDLPSHEFKNGHFSKVPVLVDHDEFEGTSFGPRKPDPFSNRSQTTTADELVDLQQVFPNAKPSFFNRIYELYPTSAYNTTFDHRVAIFGDVYVCCPTYWLAAAMTDWSLPVYKLLFYAGSTIHGATSPYVLGLNGDGTPTANDTIGAYMKDWFASFVTDLDPNAVSYSGLQKPHWPLWDDTSVGNNGFNAMNVNFTQIGVVRDFDVSDKCDFLHSQSQVTWN